MKTERLNKILAQLGNMGLSQMLISDPTSIFYLTGKWISPGERFLGLYLNVSGEHRLFINQLFTVPEDLGVQKVWFSDEADCIEIAAKSMDSSKALGVDKDLAARFLLRLMERKAASSYINASIAIDNIRACKDQHEIELMRTVSLINDEAMGQLKNVIREGVTESELAEELKKIYKSLGAEGVSFEPLIAFGANAAIGHHESGSSSLKKGDCILIDVGCKKDDYCSDMTRTFFFGAVSPQQTKIYETVKKAQLAAEKIIKPGVRFCDIDRMARDIITAENFGSYFTHRLGHFIGIDVHEYGDVSGTNLSEAKEGMIFSIEPGIYLPGETGVRIEDLVLVTQDGAEILNKYSKEIEII